MQDKELMINKLIQSKRIIIQGASGAGKSTLSIRLAELLSLPIVHLDKEYWQPGWQKPNSEEWHQKQLEFIKKDHWIIEGGAYQRALPLRVQASDFVIYLDFNRFVCFYRCLKRYFISRGKTRGDLAIGCNEQVNYEFAKWILYDQPKIYGPKAFMTIQENLPHENLVVLKKSHQVENFISALKDCLKVSRVPKK